MEKWAPVPSYNGIMASSYGRLLLPAREGVMPRGGKRLYVTKPSWGHKTKASASSKHVYMSLCTKFWGNIKIHQAVCEAFHGPRPFSDAVVIHIDEDATNNRADNLRWGTQKENLNMPRFIKYCKGRTGDNSPIAKAKKAA